MSVVSTLSRRGIITISLPFFPANRIFSQTLSSTAVSDTLLSGRRPSPPLPPPLLSADDQAWGCELRSFAGGVWWKKSEAWGGSSLLTRDKETHLTKRSHVESKMQNLGDFKLPHFFNYPPYFTLQPVRETREKQIQLWKELILEYCKSQKIFIIGLEQEFPLFTNSAIERSLSHEAREAFLSALVSEGRAEWMDKSHRKCLILWLRIQDWADCILHFVKDNGFEDSVMSVDDLRSGIETRGSELEGIDRIVLMRALKILEQRGKCAIFKGNAADDEGVKFSV